MSEWEESQAEYDAGTELESKKIGVKSKIQEIVTERATEEIQDDLTTLHHKQYKSPLSFYGKIGTGYLMSFRQKDLTKFIIRLVLMFVVAIAANWFSWQIGSVPRKAKILLICLGITCIMFYIVLFFLDPGTLFEDQQQKINEQRLYCQTCRIYRSYKSIHCVFCVKCIRGLDHHCGYFGKCIGARNYAIFVLFIASIVAFFVIGIGSLTYAGIDLTRNQI